MQQQQLAERRGGREAWSFAGGGEARPDPNEQGVALAYCLLRRVPHSSRCSMSGKLSFKVVRIWERDKPYIEGREMPVHIYWTALVQGICAVAAPGPLLRTYNQSSFHWIPVHVA